MNSLVSEFEYVNQELNELSLIKDTNKIKILLVGFYGAYNLGDDLMLKAILAQLDPTKFAITVMLSRNSKLKIDDFNHVNCIYYPKKGNDFYLLANFFDKLIFGGGAIIDDINFNLSNAYQYDLGTIFVNLATEFIKQKKEVYTISISSIEQLTDDKYIQKLIYIVRNCKYFSVRDEYSKKYLNKLCSTNKIQLLPDLVYALDYNKIDKTISKQIKNIGLIWICTNETKNTLISVLDELKEYQIHLIPFYNYLENDIIFYQALIKNRKNIIIENYTNDINELYRVFESCDIIISMRYHGILLGKIFEKKVLAINYNIHPHYHNKIAYLRQLYSLEVIDYTDLTKVSIKDKMINIFDTNNKVNTLNKKILINNLNALKKDLVNKKNTNK